MPTPLKNRKNSPDCPDAESAGIACGGDGAEEITVVTDADGALGASRSNIDFEGPTTDLGDRELGILDPPLLPDSVFEQVDNDYARYQKFAPLGSGGVGSVASCFDPNLGRFVALKKLHGHLREKVAERTRFVREARVMAQIEHPHVVPVHELGADADGNPYFTMKKVRGNTLADILREIRSGNRAVQKRYPLRYLLDGFYHIAQAVAFAHSRGIIHRDLKPSNILIGEFGEVLLVDWGLAKVVGDPADADEKSPDSSLRENESLDQMGRESVTVEGIISGTPAYMAPEQALGKVSELNGQTDIYGLGAILYEILTWQRMIHGETIREALHNVVHGTIVPPRKRAPERKIPKDIEAICLRAVARLPENRYGSVREMIQDIVNYQNDFPVSVRRDSPLDAAWKWCKRHRVASATIGASLTVLILAGGGLLLTRESKYRTLVGEAGGHRMKGAETYGKMQRAWTELRQFQGQSKARTKPSEENALEDRLKSLEYETENEFQMAIVLYSRASAHRRSNEIREGVFEIIERRINYAFLKHDFGAARRELDLVRRFVGPNFEQTTPERRERLLAFDERARGMGVLKIVTPDEAGDYSLIKFEEGYSGVLVPRRQFALPQGQTVEMSIARGSYAIQATVPRIGELRYPVHISGNPRETVVVGLPDKIPEGTVYIPGGPFVCGGEASRLFREHRVDLDDFFIKRTEVTFGEYLQFWLADDGGGRADRLRSRVRLDPETMAFVDAWDEHGALIPQFTPQMPVVGIPQSGAEAYCRWLSGRLGVAIALPTAYQWEKAARGVDGREYPWGNQFVANLALLSENVHSRRQFPLFAPAGSFPADQSVYGALDMAGNVRERTSSRFEHDSPFHQIKGGSAILTRRFAACAYSSDTPVVPSDVGFRYVIQPETAARQD